MKNRLAPETGFGSGTCWFTATAHWRRVRRLQNSVYVVWTVIPDPIPTDGVGILESSQGGSRCAAGGVQSSGEPDSRGIMPRKRASLMLKSP